MDNNLAIFILRTSIAIIVNDNLNKNNLNKNRFNYGIIASNLSKLFGSDICKRVLEKFENDKIIKIKRFIIISIKIDLTEYGKAEFSKYLNNDKESYFYNPIKMQL